MYLSHQDSIEDAEWIVRAKAVTRVNGGFKMQALEYLKGSGPNTFVLPDATTDGASYDELEPSDANYFGHESSKFWAFGGRSSNEPDCRIHPSILFGERQYLIFGPLDYNVGFENIAIENDRWLQYVRDYLKDEKPKPLFPMTFERYVGDASAIVRFRAEWKDDKAVWTEDVLKGEAASYAHRIFISPPAFFDTAVNPNCTKYGERRKLRPFDKIYVIENLQDSEILVSQHLECVGADKGSSGYIEARGIFLNNGMNEFNVITRDGKTTLYFVPVWVGHSPIWEEDEVSLEQLMAVINR